MRRILAATGMAAALVPGGISPAHGEADEAYRYNLTSMKAGECALLQGYMSRARAADADWSRYHKAMQQTWVMLAAKLNGGEVTAAEAEERTAALNARLPEGGISVAVAQELLRPCEVMSRIHDEYSAMSFELGEKDEALFAENAARKFQTGGEPAPAPTKELDFGPWKFSARGNSCTATHTFKDKTTLTFGFTNFFDGAIKLEGKKLPKLDPQADDYEEVYAKHKAGGDFDDDSAAIFAEGVDYDSYPGTAIFVDGQPVALPSFGVGKEREYVLGAYIQRPYYNVLAEGQEMTIKVLGKEKYEVSLPNPAFWNEMSNCMAQYPFG